MSVFNWKQLRFTVLLQFFATILFPCATTIIAHAQNDWFTAYVKNSNKAETAPSKDAPSYWVDVVVIDPTGQPMNWLHPGDFSLVDNQSEQRLTGFRAVDQTVMKTEDVNDPQNPPKVNIEPLEVILVLDAVNLTPPQLDLVRTQLKKFLRSNDGQMTALTRFILFTSAGTHFESPTQLNGNALADLLEKTITQPQIQTALKTAATDPDRFKISVNNLRIIVENERKSPGHKVLFWAGPGWPLNPNNLSSATQSELDNNFDAIVALMNGLREARMQLFNLRISADDESSANTYLNYLKPVSKKEQAEPGNLALQVLALQSGGRVTIPSRDVAGEITRNVTEESVYYTLRFTPNPSGKELNHHELKVKIGQPGAIARLVTGYYEAP